VGDVWVERCGLQDEPADRREFDDEEEAVAAWWIERCGGEI
jgi:hypothetical protein